MSEIYIFKTYVMFISTNTNIGTEGEGGVPPSPSFTPSNIIISKPFPTKDITKLMESGAHIEALTSNSSHIPSVSKFPHFNEQVVFDMCSSSQVIKKLFLSANDPSDPNLKLSNLHPVAFEKSIISIAGPVHDIQHFITTKDNIQLKALLEIKK